MTTGNEGRTIGTPVGATRAPAARRARVAPAPGGREQPGTGFWRREPTEEELAPGRMTSGQEGRTAETPVSATSGRYRFFAKRTHRGGAGQDQCGQPDDPRQGGPDRRDAGERA
jgi:hypothetical protein